MQFPCCLSRRFNGYGFCAGVTVGFVAAAFLFFYATNWAEYNTFAFSSAFSIAASIIGSA